MNQHLVAHKIAIAFSEKLKEQLTPTEFLSMVDRQRAVPQDGSCYSHDFCDANVVMAEAFQQVVGREPDTNSEIPGSDDLALFTKAWDFAKAELFYHPDLRALRYKISISLEADIEIPDEVIKELEAALLAQLEQLSDEGTEYQNARITTKLEE